MYSKAKYVVGEILTYDIIGSTFGALIASEVVPHAALSRLFVPNSIVGAGFFHVDSDGVKVYGESTGLKIKSRPEDAIFVAKAVAHESAHR